MNKTCAEISKLKKVSRQAVNNFIQKNTIQPIGMKGKYPLFDCAKEPLASYLAKTKPPPEPSETPEISTHSPPPNTKTARRLSKPLNDLLSGRVPTGRKPAEYFYYEAYDLAKKNQDPALFLKLAQIAAKEDADETIRLQAIKTEQARESIAIEKAERLKIENEIKRGGYIDRDTVKLIFGKQYAIDTSVLQPLGLKLADMINSLPPSPDRRNKIQDMIDNEIFQALESKKRILADWIKE
jgi:hypothetical protein